MKKRLYLCTNIFLILMFLVSTNSITMEKANAAWIQYQNSPADIYNRPDLPAEYDIIRTDFGVNDKNSDEYWFFIMFAKPVSSSIFADGKGSWAGIFLDTNNDGSLDYSLETNQNPYQGNYYKSADFVDRTSGSPVSSSRCTSQTWTNIESQANWIGFSIKKNCLTLSPTIGVQGYVDYIANDGKGFDFAPDTIWQLRLSDGTTSSSGNSSSSTIGSELPSLDNTGAADTSFPSSQPSDLVDLAAKTTKSVVTVLCSDDLGSGWSVSVALTKSSFASGYRSYVITNHHVISKCTVNRSVTLVLSDQSKVPGYVLAWNEANDVAGILTNASITGLNWRGQTPQQGWWVGVLGSPLGFPGILTTGIISSVYPETFLGTTTAPINPGNSGGPVFDRTGRVVGLATAKRIDAEGFGIFHGAPMLCGTILNCSDRSLVWSGTRNIVGANTVQPSPTPTPTPSSSKVSDLSQAVSDSHAAYLSTVADCLKVLNSTSISISKYLKILDINSRCTSNNNDAKNLLEKSKSSGNQNSNFLEEMNSFSDKVDAINAEIQDIVSALEAIEEIKSDKTDIEKFIDKDFSQLKARILKLPKSEQKRITNSFEYKQINTAKPQWSKFSSLIDDFFESLQPTTNFEYISNSLQEIRNSKPLTDLYGLDAAATTIKRMIPKYVCVRGIDIQIAVKNVCKPNYKRIST